MPNVQEFTYYLAMVVMTAVLIWGLKIVTTLLLSPDGPEPLAQTVLAEDAPDPNDPEDPHKGSFSRTAGAFGAVGMAAVTIGLGYWVLYAVFWTPDQLGKLQNIGWYYLSGSALFAPYAFNQLSRIFSITPPKRTR